MQRFKKEHIKLYAYKPTLTNTSFVISNKKISSNYKKSKNEYFFYNEYYIY